jgi:hypothetical protein
MQLAINWSPEAAELLEAGVIQFDLYKCPDWPDLVADAQAQQAAYIHFPLAIGKGQMPRWNFSEIQNWLSKTDTRFVNCHVLPDRQQFPEVIDLDHLAEALYEEVAALVVEFGADKVIIENCPLSDLNIEAGFIIQGAEPELFHRLVDATGCGLLLDIAHAYLTCHRLEQDFQTYINALPVQHIREMHVTGVGTWSSGMFGDHLPLSDADWDILDGCIARIQSKKWRKPDVMAFEYGGIGKLKDWCGSDKTAMAEQIPRLWQISKLLDG